MIEPVYYYQRRPSAIQSIVTTSAFAAAIGAGVHSAFEGYNLFKNKKICKEGIDTFKIVAEKAKRTGNKPLRQTCKKWIKSISNAQKNIKFNWRAVGYSAAWSAGLTASLGIVMLGVNALFNKNK